MVQNTLYPGFVKITYVTSGIQHSMVIPIDPVGGWDVGSEPSFEQKGGTTITMSAAIAAYIPLLQPFFSSLTEFIQAECWIYPSVSDDPIWIYSHPIGLAGTSGAATTLMSQGVISYRTRAGGIYKTYLMELASTITLNVRNSYPFGAGSVTNLVNYTIGANSWIMGRDGAFLAVPIFFTTKTNDALRKRRLGI